MRDANYIDQAAGETVRQPDEHDLGGHAYLSGDSSEHRRPDDAEHRGPRHHAGHGRINRHGAAHARPYADTPARRRPASDGGTHDNYIYAPSHRSADDPQSHHHHHHHHHHHPMHPAAERRR